MCLNLIQDLWEECETSADNQHIFKNYKHKYNVIPFPLTPLPRPHTSPSPLATPPPPPSVWSPEICKRRDIGIKLMR